MNLLIKERLREIYDKNGRITPDDVIEDAKDPSSPLHSSFNWDIKSAALAHWRDTARKLIRSVRVEIKVKSITFRPKPIDLPPEYIEDPDKEANTQGYLRCVEIASDKTLAMRAIQTEIERIEAALARSKKLIKILGLEKEISLVETAILKLKAKSKKAA